MGQAIRPKVVYHRWINKASMLEGRLTIYILCEDGWQPLVLSKAAKVGKNGLTMEEAKQAIEATIWMTLQTQMKEGAVPGGKAPHMKMMKVLAWAFQDPRVVHA